MNVHAQPAQTTFAALLQRQEHSSLLRFIACGSVDHGKSTLIGRLLYDSKHVFDDQLDALVADSRKFGTQGDELDFSLLLDGLAAEREQNITIDVAYRFFATERRKFIVIDAPGHEEYTANMATGASVADLALVLVAVDEGLTRQTKRHLVILSMLGIRHVVLAVNKMDRVGWSRDAFGAIEAAFRELATDLGFVDVACIPVAAKSGDNVTSRSGRLPWYGGPSLLDYLETVEPAQASNRTPFRMPIQWVNRPDADFRGYSGLITSGEVRVGMPVKIFPAGRVTHIARIATFDGDLARATAGRSVTLTFTDPLDASRGDMVGEAERAPAVTERIAARIFWMKDLPLKDGQNYLVKLATSTATARVEGGLSIVDLDTRRAVVTDSIGPNEVGNCTLKFDRPVALDRYDDCRDTGSFILIDPETYDTVAMGCVAEAAPLPSRPRLASWLPNRAAAAGGKLTRWTETHARSFVKAVSWRATGSLDTFVVTFVISGSTKLAGSVALTEILTKILIYYGHERIWALVPWGKRQAES
ncbi:MAG TPA: GTP-binding protein [Xanthobacteraceae bacterium]|nr:GTP-binding protein [Xanthobacteraceae bacterium]